MTDPILSVKGLDASYGPVQILFGLDLEIHRGEIVALLGTNGAGKSTLFKCVTGLLPPTAGSVVFDGTELVGMAPNEVAQRGIVMMPGGKSVFPTLSVRDNLRLASWLQRGDPAAVAAAEDRVLEMFPRLGERIDQMAGNLSGGEQQMLAISQALIPDPEILFIDELSLGLAPTIVGQLIDVVRQVHAQGLTVVVVEQSINVALNLAERAVFMEKGEFRFSGSTVELLDRPDILRSVFIAGADVDEVVTGSDEDEPASVPAAPARETPPATSPVVLECRDVVKRFGGITAVNHVDLELRQGQILGLIGQNGAGKTTLFDCVSGFLDVDAGRITLGDEDITEMAPHERAARGLGRSFQEALLFPTLTTAETLAIARERQLLTHSVVAAATGQPISRASEERTSVDVDSLIDLMGLGAFREKLTGELSTGTRRIVELACLLASDPQVIVLDEPSGGVAQKETEALGPLLQRVQQYTGASILVIEHDMPLLSSICDEMVALELGEVIARGTPTEVLDHPRVVESYLGTELAAINRSGSIETA
ncbi:ATP-binding cassette domain-containing protein [Actinospongicola halichondriae]|uniref:ATP-binding cassette domain-containing protein n=1 Tax=Actinospongicola halichondriae TaxID=3236844 RepID=UPI003D46D40D